MTDSTGNLGPALQETQKCEGTTNRGGWDHSQYK